ncbi:MAG: O-antigen ligase family protein [Acidobacteriota bacterium]
MDKANKVFAFVWLVIIGSDVAIANSDRIALQGPIILAGTAYFLFIHRRELLRLLSFGDFLFAFSLLSLPVVLTLINRFFDLATVRSTERSGSFFASVALVFLVATVLSLPLDFRRTLVRAAFTIVSIATALNLYELFIQNNRWSEAPGRSAGFYTNPNVSAEALVGYGLVVLLGRAGKLTIADFLAVSMVGVGVFTTFSRTGILLAVVLLSAAMVARTEPKHVVRVAFIAAAGAVFCLTFAFLVLQHVKLSGDAAVRIASLIERGGIGDYEKDRGEVAMVALNIGLEHPILGAGLGTIFEMPVGPHNMFVAMFVDYGIFGLLAYVLVLARLVIISWHADRKWSALLWFLAAWHVGFSFASHNLLSDAETIPLLGFAISRACQVKDMRRAGSYR